MIQNGVKWWSFTKILINLFFPKEKGFSWPTRDLYLAIFVLLTVHISIILDNDQRDAHLLYFTIYLLLSSTCFEHYMLIIRRLNCIDAASGIVTLKISEWARITRI